MLELPYFVLETKYFTEFFCFFYKNIKILPQITKNFIFQLRIEQIFIKDNLLYNLKVNLKKKLKIFFNLTDFKHI